MPMPAIGRMSLHNEGGFVARIQISYVDDDGNGGITKQSGDVPLGQTKTVDPGELGVPDGAIVYMHAFVVAGRDNQARRAFIYSKGNTAVASYVISGTTLSNKLGLVNVG